MYELPMTIKAKILPIKAKILPARNKILLECGYLLFLYFLCRSF